MRSTLRWFCSLTGLGMLLSGVTGVQAADLERHVPGRLLVGHRRDADPVTLDRTLRLHGAIVRQQLPQLSVSVLDVQEGSSEAILESLRRSALFEYVEYDHYAHTGAVPNDPSFNSQWHLSRIQSPQAWSVTTGSSTVVVAVIDSGVFGAHPDLAPKLVPGWNFVKWNSDTSDLLGHGTAVAGTVAAASNNGIGVAGVNWRSLVMPLVVADENDFAAYSHIAAAIQYAVDHGVRIINISIGGTSPSAVLQSAVDYAWNRGAVVFASAMNESTSKPYYPAACTHAIAVSATDSNDHLASFSNFGSWVSVAAPGTNILTTMNGGGYGYWFGTSFASPIVAGVAALSLAIAPKLTNTELVTLLKQTADDIGENGYDSSFGWGRVNAYRMVSGAQKAAADAVGTRPHIPHHPPSN